MKKLTLFLLFAGILFPNTYALSKKNSKTIQITYQNSFNNKIDSTSLTIMDISGTSARISTESSRRKNDDPIQVTYLNYADNIETKVANLAGGETIYTTKEFTINDGLTFLPDTEKIAGYMCKKAKSVVNSNTIEIWYTTELGVSGTIQTGVGVPEGVVLKIVRNGQTAQTAVSIKKLDTSPDLAPILSGVNLSTPAYNYKIQQSKVISVKVFDHESIYFRKIPKVTKLEENKVLRFANGSIILRKVKLPQLKAGYSIFAELSQYSEGDAYDRTGSIFMVPVDKEQSFLDGLLNGKEYLPQYIDKSKNIYQGIVATEKYLPPIELLRFYTSFGVRGYNNIKVANYNWPDSIVYKQEISDYASILQNEVWIGAWIGNYSENGHNVTLDIKYYPKGDREEKLKKVYPLFTTTNIMEMAGQTYPENLFRNDTLSMNFNIESDLKNVYIRYTSTGHGGWGGGDEFNPKLNEIFLDGNRLIAYTPWREDCGSYRELNPASGNFANGLSSSDLSRSGWCPGMTSYPVYVYVGNLKAGNHNIKLAIPVGDPEGSSHSYWCTSAVLVGDE